MKWKHRSLQNFDARVRFPPRPQREISGSTSYRSCSGCMILSPFSRKSRQPLAKLQVFASHPPRPHKSEVNVEIWSGIEKAIHVQFPSPRYFAIMSQCRGDETVDIGDLKFPERKLVWVRFPPSALNQNKRRLFLILLHSTLTLCIFALRDHCAHDTSACSSVGRAGAS